MAEKFAALEDGQITVGEAKAFVGLGSIVVNACKVEMVQNATLGLNKEIDFLEYEVKNGNGKELASGLKDELLMVGNKKEALSQNADSLNEIQ